MVENFNNNTKDYGIYIPGEVLRNTSLTPMAKILYGEILLLSRQKGYCFASNAFFIKKYNISKQSIRNWIKALKTENLIEIEINKIDKYRSKRKIKIIGGLPPNYLVVVPQKKLPHNITRTNKQGGNNIPQNIFDINHKLKEI